MVEVSAQFAGLWSAMEEQGLIECLAQAKARVQSLYAEDSADAHGDWPKWRSCLDELSNSQPGGFKVQEGRVHLCGQFPPERDLRTMLMQLHPWRKGPFRFGDLLVDTEWRSDWKWARLQKKIEPLKGRRILDVGCGNGYHLWHMLAEGARLAIGIDPVQLYGCQFLAARHFASDVAAGVLPYTLEDWPATPEAFDTVFSMGVLYHRKSPVEHLEQLYALLRLGGELILETLIVEKEELLLPSGRYAQMRNVWFLFGLPLLEKLLARAGFRSVEVIDVNRTTIEEQRSTEWMRFQSLTDYLDAQDVQKTVEGYPAPVRAILKATK